MTHKKTTKGRKAFVKAVLKRTTPKKIYKIYRATEKIIGYKHKKHKRY